jgi:hypothetical protein
MRIAPNNFIEAIKFRNLRSDQHPERAWCLLMGEDREI